MLQYCLDQNVSTKSNLFIVLTLRVYPSLRTKAELYRKNMVASRTGNFVKLVVLKDFYWSFGP